ncbi:hypothetical protein GCM10009608_46520 [Pseudonocardia alaniniphila]
MHDLGGMDVLVPDVLTAWPRVVSATSCGMQEIRGGADDVDPGQRLTCGQALRRRLAPAPAAGGQAGPTT